MENKGNIQEHYVKLQYLAEQIREIEKQNQLFNNQIVELTATSQSLDDFKKIKEGTEILVPLSQGIYTKAELKNNKNVLVNVGSNVSVKKSVDETKQLIDAQIDEVKKIQDQMIFKLQKLSSQAAMIEKEISNISGKK